MLTSGRCSPWPLLAMGEAQALLTFPDQHTSFLENQSEDLHI